MSSFAPSWSALPDKYRTSSGAISLFGKGAIGSSITLAAGVTSLAAPMAVGALTLARITRWEKQFREGVARQASVDAFDHPRVGVAHRRADKLRFDSLRPQPRPVRASKIVR